jgi:hypothetical protein
MRFTGLQPAGSHPKTARVESAGKQSEAGAMRQERRSSMSTINHTSQAALRIHPGRRLTVLAALLALVAVAAVTIAIVASGTGSQASRSAPPSHAELERQLESVAGPRYGVTRPGASTPSVAKPADQLQAVAGPRYRQPVGIHELP